MQMMEFTNIAHIYIQMQLPVHYEDTQTIGIGTGEAINGWHEISSIKNLLLFFQITQFVAI